MKPFKSTSLLTTLSIFTLICTATLRAQDDRNQWDQPYVNGIAAVVEDRIITLEELRREIGPLVPQIRLESRNRQEFDQRIAEVTNEVLQNMIDRILIIREFDQSGYQIPQTYLDSEFADYITTEFDGDRPRFLNFLQSQGMTVRQFRSDLRDRIVVNFMRGRMRRSQTEVSPAKIEEYYRKNESQFFKEEAVRLRQIVISPMSDRAALQARVDEVVAELEGGTPFADVARKFSQDERRAEGGDWGWINRSDIRKELADVAFTTAKGKYSHPVELDGYIFILFVEDVRKEGIQPIHAVREQIEIAITSQLARQAQEQWIERLRRDAYIKFYVQEATHNRNQTGIRRM